MAGRRQHKQRPGREKRPPGGCHPPLGLCQGCSTFPRPVGVGGIGLVSRDGDCRMMSAAAFTPSPEGGLSCSCFLVFSASVSLGIHGAHVALKWKANCSSYQGLPFFFTTIYCNGNCAYQAAVPKLGICSGLCRGAYRIRRRNICDSVDAVPPALHCSLKYG